MRGGASVETDALTTAFASALAAEHRDGIESASAVAAARAET